MRTRKTDRSGKKDTASTKFTREEPEQNHKPPKNIGKRTPAPLAQPHPKRPCEHTSPHHNQVLPLPPPSLVQPPRPSIGAGDHSIPTKIQMPDKSPNTQRPRQITTQAGQRSKGPKQRRDEHKIQSGNLKGACLTLGNRLRPQEIQQIKTGINVPSPPTHTTTPDPSHSTDPIPSTPHSPDQVRRSKIIKDSPPSTEWEQARSAPKRPTTESRPPLQNKRSRTSPAQRTHTYGHTKEGQNDSQAPSTPQTQGHIQQITPAPDALRTRPQPNQASRDNKHTSHSNTRRPPPSRAFPDPKQQGTTQ
ncbi:hypothetical protein CRENBAI_017849 [Crenichthys baileyi]|uniref:Uncharacterized protein n=1 Tax=Crenichthys baileyi TaxID=28760 RepID=A0AAV9RY46_9TELE